MSKEKLGGGGGGKESTSEKAARLYRNLNAIGAIALGGLAIFAPPIAAGALGGLAGLDVLQAGGAEVYRRHRKKKRLKGG
jgi:hypothetical protein